MFNVRGNTNLDYIFYFSFSLAITFSNFWVGKQYSKLLRVISSTCKLVVWLNKVKSLSCFRFDYFIFMGKYKISLGGRKSKFFRFTRDNKSPLISLSSSYTFLVLKCNTLCMRFHLRCSWIVSFKFHITCFTKSIRMLCCLNPPVIFFPLLLVFTFVLNPLLRNVVKLSDTL